MAMTYREACQAATQYGEMTTRRDALIIEFLEAGLTVSEVGRRMAVSRVLIYEVIKREARKRRSSVAMLPARNDPALEAIGRPPPRAARNAAAAPERLPLSVPFLPPTPIDRR